MSREADTYERSAREELEIGRRAAEAAQPGPPCLTCGGDGEAVVYPGASVDPRGEPVRDDCPTCDGTGEA